MLLIPVSPVDLIKTACVALWIVLGTMSQSLHVEPEKIMCLLYLMTNSIHGEDYTIYLSYIHSSYII